MCAFRLLFGTVTSADVEQIKMYYGQDGMRGLHIVSVVMKELDATVNAADLEMKMKPYINVSDSHHWLGWRVSGLAECFMGQGLARGSVGLLSVAWVKVWLEGQLTC